MSITIKTIAVQLMQNFFAGVGVYYVLFAPTNYTKTILFGVVFSLFFVSFWNILFYRINKKLAHQQHQ